MTTLETHPVDQSALGPAELAGLMQAYQEATERLQTAHAELQREVARLHRELAAKNAELARKERLAALGHMATGVAHEIRNPLGAIRLFVGILERDLVRAAETDVQPEIGRLRDYTEKVARAVTHMDGIVEGMLSLARTREPALLPCDVAVVLEHAVEAAAPELERCHTVVTRGHMDAPSVLADADQLRRAFVNIIVNAAQMMETGGDLRLTLERERDRVRVRFADAGPGIDPEHLDRIFEPFFTAREGGTGLGLALVHRIVEGHRGRLWAQNEPAGGATFVVELPISEDADDARASSNRSA